METVSQLALGAAAGFSAALLYLLRKALAPRQDSWPAVFSKLMRLVFMAWGLATAGTAVIALSAGTSMKTAIVGGFVGLLMPFLLRRKPAGSPVTTSSGQGGLVDARGLKKAVKSARSVSRLELAGVPVPASVEPRPWLIVGSADDERQQVLDTVVAQLRASNDTVILVDPGAELLSRHYAEDSDFIFNPFDQRSISWSPLNELRTQGDADALARSLVGTQSDATGSLNDARVLLASLLDKASRVEPAKERGPAIIYYALSASSRELARFVAGTAAGALAASETHLTAARAHLSSALSSFAYLDGPGEPFSVSEMIEAEHSGFLFLTYRQDQVVSFEGTLACLLDAAARALLAGSGTDNRRVWLVLASPEFADRVPNLGGLVHQGAAVGATTLLAARSAPEMNARAGAGLLSSFWGPEANIIALRADDLTTAQLVSTAAGDQAPPASPKAVGKKPVKADKRKSRKESNPEADAVPLLQPLLPPDKVQHLGKGQTLMRLGPALPVALVAWPRSPSAPARSPRFVERDFTVRPLVKALAPVYEAALPAAPAPAPEELNLASSRDSEATVIEPAPVAPSRTAEPSEQAPVPDREQSETSVVRPAAPRRSEPQKAAVRVRPSVPPTPESAQVESVVLLTRKATQATAARNSAPTASVVLLTRSGATNTAKP